jgi:uncharacterized membrane protein
MNEWVLICCFAIGFAAGLRSMTPPAVISWAALLGRLNVSAGPFYFVGTLVLVAVLTAWALFELVVDKTGKFGDRTGAVGLTFRVVTSSICGAVVYSTTGAIAIGAVAGLCGGIVGTYLGFYVRRAIVQKSGLRDLYVAITEDILEIGLACVFVFLAAS